MQRADVIKIIHADDSVTTFQDVQYTLCRDGVRVLERSGKEHSFDDVVDSQAYRERRPR